MKSLFMIVFFMFIAGPLHASDSPTIGGDMIRVENFMQQAGATVLAKVADPLLMEKIGLVGVQEYVQVKNIDCENFLITDPASGQQVVTDCAIWRQ